MPYPHLMLLEPSDAVALILPSLDKGDLPVLCGYNGEVRRIHLIRKSAIVLNTLSKVTKLRYATGPDSAIELNTVSDIMGII